jgi:hypothetical protein
MTHLERAPLDELADLGGQLEQPQKIRDPGTRAADRVGGLLVGEPEFAD